VVSELRKVHWPTRQETVAATIVVIVVVMIVSLWLGLVDGIISFFLHSLPGRAVTMATAMVAEKKWYVVHTYSGLRAQGESRARRAHPFDGQGRILRRHPRSRRKSRGARLGQTPNVVTKFFPGYILVNMALNGRHLATS
jgi:preprotein translocase SecE subunit